MKTEHIVPLEERISHKPLSVQIKEALMDLSQAKNSGRICTGRIVALKELEDKERGKVICASILYKGCVSVLIPAHLLIDKRIYPKQGDIQRDKRLIMMRQGSEVDFFIVQVFEDEENLLNSLILGDRLAAMRQIRKNDLLPKGEEAFIKPGDIVEARITFVAAEKMGVEVRGFETILATHEITYDYYASLTDGFEAGEVIPLRVLSVQITGEGPGKDVAAMKLTGKDIGIDNRDVALANLSIGSIIPCEVTGITKKLVFVQYLYAPWTICCKPPKHFDTPMRFERVQVKIDKIDPIKKRIYGLIISAHGIR